MFSDKWSEGAKMGKPLANGADQVEKDVFIALAKRFKSVNISKNAKKWPI